MKYGQFHENGLPIIFYDDDIHTDIPHDVQAVTDDQWQELVDNWGFRAFLNDQVVPYDQPPVPPSADQLLSHLANHRWAVETGGIQLNGVTVATDDRSKTMLLGARIAADADPEHTVNWKMPDGSWGTLTSTQIVAMSNAVLNHVHQCFAKELEVANLIESGDIVGFEGVELAFYT